MESSLLNQTVVATDAATVTVNGVQNYIRNFSTNETDIYHAMDSKSIASLKEDAFLAKYSGLLLHDHETALYHFGTGHEECNVHIIRYRRKNTEETGNKWSAEMISLLCDMNRTRKNLTGQGIGSFSQEDIKKYEQKYQNLLIKGRGEN